MTVSAGQRTDPIFPYKEEVGGSSPSTPTGEAPAQVGVSARMGVGSPDSHRADNVTISRQPGPKIKEHLVRPTLPADRRGAPVGTRRVPAEAARSTAQVPYLEAIRSCRSRYGAVTAIGYEGKDGIIRGTC